MKTTLVIAISFLSFAAHSQTSSYITLNEQKLVISSDSVSHVNMLLNQDSFTNTHSDFKLREIDSISYSRTIPVTDSNHRVVNLEPMYIQSLHRRIKATPLEKHKAK